MLLCGWPPPETGLTSEAAREVAWPDAAYMLTGDAPPRPMATASAGSAPAGELVVACPVKP